MNDLYELELTEKELHLTAAALACVIFVINMQPKLAAEAADMVQSVSTMEERRLLVDKINRLQEVANAIN